MIREENSSAVELMERVLREGAPIREEYPLVFGDEAPGRIVTIEEDGEVRSTCAILVRDLITPHVSFRIGLVGSVSTHPDHRGRGLATRVLAAAEDELRAEGCLFSLLWADDPGFYARRGYQEIGTELDYVIRPKLSKKFPSSEEVRPADPKDLMAVHSLYMRHDQRIERTPGETERLMATPGMEMLVKEDTGEVVAYSCMGRGADMQGVVHEWAGAPEHVAACLHAHLRRRAMQGDTSDLYLIAPADATGLKKTLARLGARSAPGVLGMGKLLNLQKLVELYAWFLGPDGNVRVDQRPAQLREDGKPGLRIQGPNMALLFEAEEAFRILFSPRGEERDVKYLRRALGLKLDMLPLKPFVWGLDAI